jgi:hypothetical protein
MNEGQKFFEANREKLLKILTGKYFFSPFEAEVAYMTCLGLDCDEISTRLQVTYKSARDAKTRFFRKIIHIDNSSHKLIVYLYRELTNPPVATFQMKGWQDKLREISKEMSGCGFKGMAKRVDVVVKAIGDFNVQGDL